MKIRNATEDDLPYVVDVHLRAFQGFFLTQLGPGFLRELYRAFAFRPAGVLRVVSNEDGRIVGFAGGTLSPETFYRALKKEKLVVFFLKALPGLLRNPIVVVRKLWYALFYKGEEPSSIGGAALLSSIAVDQDMAGKSLGKRLLQDFENEVKNKGAKSLFLTTDKYGNDHVVDFYLANGYSVESEFIQSGGREMIRFLKIFNEAQ